MAAQTDNTVTYGPLSQSKLYRLMTDYYVQAGVNAWVDHVVPHYISSNAKLAQSYASVIVSGMWDLHHQGKLTKNEPFVVLELGAGSGALAWLLAQALMRLLNERSNSALPPVLYVVSDVAQSNIDTMMDDKSGFNEWFDVLETESLAAAAEDMERLSIDWALVDLTGDCRSLHLQSSGVTIGPASLTNPMCILGTYLLDSIPQDAFRCIGGELFAQWCSFESRRPTASATASEGSLSCDDSSDDEGSVVSPLGPQGFQRSAEVDLQWQDHSIPSAQIDSHLQQAAYAQHSEETRDILGTILHWYQQYFQHDSAEYTQDPVAAAGAGNRTRGGSVDTDDSLDSTGAPLGGTEAGSEGSESGSDGEALAQGGRAASTEGGVSSATPPAPPRKLLGASIASNSTKGARTHRSMAESVDDAQLQGALAGQLTPEAVQGGAGGVSPPPLSAQERPDDKLSDSQEAALQENEDSDAASGSGTFRSHSSGSRTDDSDSDESTEVGVVSAAFTIPSCAVSALEQLRGVTRGCVLCLWGDKGNCSPTSYVGQSSPHVSLHGSFSLMVNFHALTLYAELCGGFVLLPGRAEMSLTSCAMVLPPKAAVHTTASSDALGEAVSGGVASCASSSGGTEQGGGGATHRAGVQYAGDSDSDEYGDSTAAVLGQISLHNPETAAGWALLTARLSSKHASAPPKPWAHARAEARFWPALAGTVRSVLGVFSPDDFFYLQEDLSSRGPPQSLRQCLALCNLAAWDPHVVQACMPVLQQRLAAGRYTLKHDFLLGIRRAWVNWYRVLASNKCDLPFDIGLLWMSLGDMVRAEAFLTASLRYVGPHHTTHYHIARCRAHAKRNMTGAVESLHESLELLPGYEDAMNFLQHVLRYQDAAAHAEKLGLKAVFVGGDSDSASEGSAAQHVSGGSYVMNVSGEKINF